MIELVECPACGHIQPFKDGGCGGWDDERKASWGCGHPLPEPEDIPEPIGHGFVTIEMSDALMVDALSTAGTGGILPSALFNFGVEMAYGTDVDKSDWLNSIPVEHINCRCTLVEEENG